MKNLESIYPFRVYLFFLLFLLLGPSIILISPNHGQIMETVVPSLFYGAMVVTVISDRKRFVMTLLCSFRISDYLLAKKAVLELRDKKCKFLQKISKENSPKKISKVLRKQITGNRKNRIMPGSSAQVVIDHLMKNLANKTCEPTRHLDLSRETIQEMRNNPDVLSEERLEEVFRKETKAKEKIELLNKEIYLYLFLAEASGLRIWPEIEGYISQKFS